MYFKNGSRVLEWCPSTRRKGIPSSSDLGKTLYESILANISARSSLVILALGVAQTKQGISTPLKLHVGPPVDTPFFTFA
jgi:hypothetical protein